jgi:signal transduction histidine kinase
MLAKNNRMLLSIDLLRSGMNVLKFGGVDPGMFLRPIRVQGDADALERLFLIFLENAVKYTPFGGHVDVRLRSENSAAIAEVRDSGIGIAATDIPHIFERFYQADQSRSRENGGRGLGLAIGRWIAQAHGGDISVESKVGEGSSFQIRLPLSY